MGRDPPRDPHPLAGPELRVALSLYRRTGMVQPQRMFLSRVLRERRSPRDGW